LSCFGSVAIGCGTGYSPLFPKTPLILRGRH
jgi:hypothetical protein